jgi:hypothetical protein
VDSSTIWKLEYVTLSGKIEKREMRTKDDIEMLRDNTVL